MNQKTETNARAAALDIYTEIMERGAFSHLALREGLEAHAALSARDRAFVTRLVEGGVERSIQLDAVLDAYSSTKTAKMKPFIRSLLRLGVYQLLFLDRVPDAAAINEAVKLARKRGFSGLSGFVNGVLRKIARERKNILARLADPAQTPPALRFSLPGWLWDYLEELYGAEEAAQVGAWFLSEDNAAYVRYSDGSTGKLSGNIAETEAFRRGELTVQDYASQQVGLWAAPQPGDYVADLCAAPGGKSCHIAALLNGTGCVDARDLSTPKVRMIEENAARLRLKNLKTKVWDARIPDPALKTPDGKGRADLVLADLPCSGLGIIGKKPDIKLRMSMEQIQELQQLQREILKTAQSYIKPGGRLIYSTCTLTREENEDNARWIEEHLGLHPLRTQRYTPGHPSDGFFIAEFRKPQTHT